MTLSQLAVFFAISFLAAIINAVAGGGSFLTFPVFIMNGLTATQANIMSTIALWPGALASIFGYRSEMAQNKKQLIPFIITGIIGGSIGAVWFLHTPESTFSQLVPWLLLSATLIFTFGKYAIAGIHRLSLSNTQRTCFAIVLQIIISLYGGYFGAGIGILTLAMLQILGHANIHHMNALKTIITTAINAATVIVFIFSGKVLWASGGIMIAGGVCGGYFGARLALKLSPHHVRIMVSVIGFSMSAYFFLRGI